MREIQILNEYREKVAIHLITVLGRIPRAVQRICSAMWLLTGVARWKLYLFIVAGRNNPSDTWEIFTAIKISKKNFMSVICVRAMDVPCAYTLKDFMTGLHEPFPTLEKKSSHARIATSCASFVEKMMYLHCYSGTSLKTLTFDCFIEEIVRDLRFCQVCLFSCAER